MANLNLSSGEFDQKRSREYMGGGFWVALIILILVGALYGAMLFLNKDASAKIEAVQDRYKAEFEDFVAGGTADAVIDFQSRSAYARNLIEKEERLSDVMTMVESTILPAVHLDSFAYDKEKKTITLFCVGDNFNTVAKQILSFKDSDYFSVVSPGDSGVDAQTSQLTFEVELVLK